MTDDRIEGRPRKIALQYLFLDPNNFRIVDHPEYKRIPSGEEFKADVQRRSW